MTTLISFVIVLGVLIFIHELGHFLVAKFSGVGVEKFSLGFGPKLIGFRKGETEYRVSLLPLGGYVKMVGENPGEEVTDRERSRSFKDQSVLTRGAIVASGPIMNLVLAVILLPLIFIIGINIPGYLEKPAEIGYVVRDEAASRTGLEKGDVIERINGKEIENWEDLLSTLTINPEKELRITVARGGETFVTTLTPGTSDLTGVGSAGILPPMEPVIGELSAGYPAEEAGLRPGDVIRAIDGVEITHWAELESFIKDNGEERHLTVSRGSETFEVELTPRYNESSERFLIGVTREEGMVFRSYGVGESVKKGFVSTYDMAGRLFIVIKGLVVGDYSLKTLGGPIMIAQVAGRAAEEGLVDLLSLVAFLSLQLGIINLFPIPVLDGGHIMFLLVELVKGKPLSEKFLGIAHQVGIALIVTLMVLVTYNDIFRIFG